jgi:EAL domain-containing protein (putative c-di-GMP-specific phosphodiesterase class I)
VLDLLDAHACDIGQGYYLSRPQNPAALTPWLHRTGSLRRSTASGGLRR